ncbi:MAG: hypothetical protein ABI565_11050 [Vicinamibacteria bacterium]
MTSTVRWAVALALLFGGAARFDAVSRIYAPDVDQRTDVRRYYQSMAESVLAGKGFIPSYPTNFIPPPGQAVFILIPKWLAPSIDFRQLRLLQAVVSTATILLGFRVAFLSWGAAAGVTVAWLLALFYPLIYYVGTLVPETNYIACLFGFALACVEAGRAPGPGRFALAGTLLGMAVCFKPVPSLLGIALLPWVWMSSPRALKKQCAVAFFLCAWTLPGVWIARNAVHYGRLYPVSTNGGTLLALANNEGIDPSRADMIYWDDLYRRGDLYRDPGIEARFEGAMDVDGKPEENLKDRAYARKTLAYVAEHPLHFVRNYAVKLANFLVYPRPADLPKDDRPWPYRGIPFLQDPLLVLGLVGLAALLADRHQGREAAPLIILVVYLMAMGALMHLTRDGRMNLPLRALLALPAGFVVSRLLGRLGLSDPRPARAMNGEDSRFC